MTFTRAIEVAPGEPLTSRQQRSLARALNDRLRFAVDLPWRVAWALYNGARLVRNPAEDGLTFPAEGEFWKFYSHFKSGTIDWPLSGPGEPEGANLGSVLPQFIFGREELSNEPERLAELFPLRLNGQLPQSEAEWWRLGQLQRGAIDLNAGAQYVPAFEAAQTLYRFSFHPLLWHGKSYGGFLPTPPLHDTYPYCSAGNDFFSTWPNRVYYWTSFDSNPNTDGLHGTITTVSGGRKRVTYAGSCPCTAPNSGAGHVVYLAEYPFAWYVYVWDGTYDDSGNCRVLVDRLDKAVWQEGPYEGAPQPRHTDYPVILRTAWHYLSLARGTQAQRTPDSFDIRRVAFDHQRFWTTQYPLAPARALRVGDSLQTVYPYVELTSPTSAPVPFSDESGPWTPHPGFVIAGFLITVSGATGLVRGELHLDDQRRSFSLEPDEHGTAERIIWLPEAATPQTMSLHVPALPLVNGGRLRAEAAELLDYKPQAHDAYLVLRCATANGERDPDAQDITNAASIVPMLLTRGTLVGNYPAAQQNSITANPLYESWRRLSRVVRFIPRSLLRSYEVTNGEAILRFSRRLPGHGLDEADPWEGIAPSHEPVPSGRLEIGRSYAVRGTGTVVHAGETLNPGMTFVARRADYSSDSGALVYEADGIVHAAPKQGWTNQWVMFLQTHVYHPSETNLWKPSIYGDFFTFGTPEHFYSPSVSLELRRFINATYTFSDPEVEPPLSSMSPPGIAATLINPEAPSAYTYALGANAAASAQFKASRQVYPMPYFLVSVMEERDAAGDPIVMIRLDRRLRSHPNAPSVVPADPLTWDADAVARLHGTHASYPEDYRTDDNAVREYLRLVATGENASFKVGDCGYGGSPIPSCFGNVLPCFVFVKLVPEAHEDGNELLDRHDSRIVAETYEHAALVLDTICEAFVDDATSAERACTDPSYAGLYDFTREALYAKAFSDRSLAPFPQEVRPDRPVGFGPLPNSVIFADTHNRLCRAVNLLTRLRLEVPLLWEYRERWYSGQRSVEPVVVTGTCDSAGPRQAWIDDQTMPPASTLSYDSGWIEATSPPTLTAFSGFGLGCCSGTSNWCVASTVVTTEWRVQIHPDWVLAVPAHLLSLVSAGQVGTIVQVQRNRYHYRRLEEPPMTVCDGLAAANRWDEVVEVDSVECRSACPGLLAAPAAPAGDLGVFKPTANSVPCEWGAEDSQTWAFLSWGAAYVDIPSQDLP